jgi:hypothetical protein
VNGTDYGLDDTVPAGRYDYSIYIGCDHTEGSRRGEWTFDSDTTGRQAMHTIARRILLDDGVPEGVVYKVEWLFLDVAS